MRFILGITGGIGSGKSAATQWFESQGIRVIDADVVAREIVEPGQPALQKIQQLFGDWVLLVGLAVVSQPPRNGLNPRVFASLMLML